jgi:protein tyrosine/serine phosphatase
MNFPRFIRRLFRAPYDGLRHFGIVDGGKLYRCGQPTPEQLAGLIDQYGLKTVVSLRGSRGAADPDAWEQAERSVCEARGAQFVTFPCNHKNPPTAQQVREFLGLTQDRGRRPVLVHCRLGQQRTLLFCGLYRVHAQGIDPAAALSEMDELGFRSRIRRHKQFVAAFHALSHGLDGSKGR